MDDGVRNPELIKAMAAADAVDAAADEATRLAHIAAVYRALRRAMIVLPMHETSIALREDQFFIRTHPGPDGGEAITAYTDFEAAPADTRCHAMPFVELCKRIASTGLAVAIWGAPRVGLVPAYWVRALADGEPEMPAPITVAASVHRIVKVEAVDRVRPALMQRLVTGVTANPVVSAAYLVLATFDDGGRLSRRHGGGRRLRARVEPQDARNGDLFVGRAASARGRGDLLPDSAS